MHIMRLFALAGCLVLAAASGPAQAPPAIAEAEEAPAALPDMPMPQVELRYDSLLGSDELSIQRQIDVDVIDLEDLRRALEAQFGQYQVRLTLEDCIVLALDRNPDILVSQYEPMQAAGDLLSAHGEFDPILGTSITYTEASSVASQQLIAFGGISSIESWTTTTTTQVSQKLRLGTIWNVSFAMNKEENTFGRFIEEWDGMLTVTLTQPLLRGFGTRVNTVRIRQATNARAMAEEQLRLTVMQAVSEVIKAYWDLVGAVENLKVRQESLANAERLLKINETRRQIGTAADIDVLQAKAGVATRQSELIAARAAVGMAEDQLKRLIDLRDGELLSRARVIPLDRPHIDPDQSLDPMELEDFVLQSVQRALDNRPEMQIAELGIENAQLEELSARNQMLPQVDITGTYGQGGRDHKPRQVFYGMRDGDTDVMSISLQGQVPIGNRAARGQHLRAQLGVRSAEQRLLNAQQQLMFGVHLAVRNLFTNQNLVASTRQAREFQEVSVVAEEKRLRLGVTTSYQVLLVQQDLTAAQTQEVQAIVDYEKARTDLRLAEGTLLQELGVEFEPPEPEAPVSFFESVTPRMPW